jgi:phage shock protein A
MGILKRIGKILTMDIHALLDKAEDVEKAADQLIREMQECVDNARPAVAGVIATKKQLEEALARSRHMAEKWTARAEEAVETGRDDLARRALLKKRESGIEAEKLVLQVEEAEKTCQTLKENLRLIEEKLEFTKLRRDALASRKQAARAQKRVHEVMGTLTHAGSVAEKMEHLERRVRRMEAEAAAAAELASMEGTLDGEFERLEKESGIEDELAELKRRKGSR